MSDKKMKNIYDDDNIPEIDLPRDDAKGSKAKYNTESFAESSQSAKDEEKRK